MILKRDIIAIFRDTYYAVFRDITMLIKNFAIYRGKQQISRFFAVNCKFRDISYTAIKICLCLSIYYGSWDLVLNHHCL